MHERIARNLVEAIEYIRFSFTPYTNNGTHNPKEYFSDFANMLRIYRPVVDHLLTKGANKYHVAITQFRYKPLVFATSNNLEDKVISDHHVLHIGPYVLISAETKKERPPIAKVLSKGDRSIKLDQKPCPYHVIVSDQSMGSRNWEKFAVGFIKELSERQDPSVDRTRVSHHLGQLIQFENEDGPYYAVDDPAFCDPDKFDGLNIYPKTANRLSSGYFDSHRPFLRAILQYKQTRELGVNEDFDLATWDDVDKAIKSIWDRSKTMKRVNSGLADYLEKETIPMARAYQKILQQAGYSPAYFFSPWFTRDLGHLSNVGRATSEFKGLVSRKDIPPSPNEYRSAGADKSHPEAWQWFPGVNPNNNRLCFVIAKLDRTAFRPDKSQRYFIDGLDFEVIPYDESKRKFLMPGLPK
jgi:hypothetical protein